MKQPNKFLIVILVMLARVAAVYAQSLPPEPIALRDDLAWHDAMIALYSDQVLFSETILQDLSKANETIAENNLQMAEAAAALAQAATRILELEAALVNCETAPPVEPPDPIPNTPLATFSLLTDGEASNPRPGYESIQPGERVTITPALSSSIVRVNLAQDAIQPVSVVFTSPDFSPPGTEHSPPYTFRGNIKPNWGSVAKEWRITATAYTERLGQGEVLNSISFVLVVTPEVSSSLTFDGVTFAWNDTNPRILLDVPSADVWPDDRYPAFAWWASKMDLERGIGE